MQYHEFDLRNEEINGFMPKLRAYIADRKCGNVGKKTRPAVLVCPGGGYEGCSAIEGEPVALRFVAEGYNAFVLNYAIAPKNHYPEPQKNASDAISFIRKNADKFDIDPERIVVVGFSAGAHLAASVATMWDEEPIKTPDGSNRPNAAILCYPVISYKRSSHKASFENLCGDNIELCEKLSLEERVSDKTPPCFIWHTFSDGVVPVENSLLFGLALKKAKIPFEMHIFPDGPHGLSLATEETACNEVHINKRAQEWVGLSVKWLKDLFD